VQRVKTCVIEYDAVGGRTWRDAGDHGNVTSTEPFHYNVYCIVLSYRRTVLGVGQWFNATCVASDSIKKRTFQRDDFKSEDSGSPLLNNQTYPVNS